MSPNSHSAAAYFSRYGKLLLINLIIVALIGCIMRYKIGFEFPYLDQKHLQHAHSHFAFANWISLSLYLIILHSMQNQDRWTALLHKLIFAQYLMGFGMLFSFAVAGYNWLSITFSTATVIISYLILSLYYRYSKQESQQQAWQKWYHWALIWQAISSIGTFSLAYMMASHHFEQHTYLASVFFFLHFQYNGWFLFGIIGSALYFLKRSHDAPINDRLSFDLLKWSVVPAYGLSVLWMDLPWIIYGVIVVFVILQTIGIARLMLEFYKLKNVIMNKLVSVVKWGSIFSAVAYVIKFMLQLFSVIPAIHKLAFGFRPIVIAYLHLVLLAATSTTLILLMTGLGIFKFNRRFAIGFYLLITGIFFNESILAIQGFASLEYIAIPWANTALLFVSLAMLTGITIMFVAQFASKQNSQTTTPGHNHG
ncbi:MAG: hypothetical protein U0V54_15205 [Saprospiraceae bacterium]